MRVNKILISSDLLRPLIETDGNIEYFHKARLDKYFHALNWQIQEAVSIPVEKFSFDNTDFSMCEFYRYCGIELKDAYSWLNIYDLENIPSKAIEYYEQYIKNSFVLYHEVPNIIKKIHNLLCIPYLDQNVHPIRFIMDNIWGFTTNSHFIFERMKSYQIDERMFYLYANMIRAQVKTWEVSRLAPHSLLFAGQTSIDKSLVKKGRLLNLFDFEKQFCEFGKKYSKVYFKVHPYDKNFYRIHDFLHQFDFVEIINENIYKLLADKNIDALAAISSGTLYEAKYFNKKSIFLADPYIQLNYDHDSQYSETTMLSIRSEFMDPTFWADILQDILEVKTGLKPLSLPFRPNEIRVAFGDYWGQTELDPSVRMTQFRYDFLLEELRKCDVKHDTAIEQFCQHIKNEIDFIKMYIDDVSKNTFNSYIKKIWNFPYIIIKQNIKQNSFPKWFINFIACFIPKKKNRVSLRKKYIKVNHNYSTPKGEILVSELFISQPAEAVNSKDGHGSIDMFAYEAIYKVLSSCKFKTVLDIGCGDGRHSNIFLEHMKDVTAIDYGRSIYFKKNANNIHVIHADFNTYKFTQKFDLIWASHILEHQLNVHDFLSKVYNLINENGWLAITVPPAKETIVGGHVTIWNAGLLLYNLVLAGFDCSKAKIKKYGYNISIIVQKKQKIDLSNLEFDAGDIKKIQKYLPRDIVYTSTGVDTPFDGNIFELNWR